MVNTIKEPFIMSLLTHFQASLLDFSVGVEMGSIRQSADLSSAGHSGLGRRDVLSLTLELKVGHLILCKNASRIKESISKWSVITP